MTLRRVALLVVSVSVVLALTACSVLFPRSATFENLAGAYVHDDGEGHVATLTVHEDGTFDVTNVPVEVFTFYESDFWQERIAPQWDGEVDWSRAVNLAGTVEVNSSGSLSMDIPASSLNDRYSLVKNWGGSYTLTFVVGNDADETFVFTRVNEE